MSLIDLLFLFIAGSFIFAGLYHGFIRTLGSLVGLIGGMFIAIYALEWIGNIWPATTNSTVQFILFVVVLIAASQLIGFIFELIDKTYKILTIIPFLDGFNKLFGGMLGALEAFVVLSGILYYAENQLSDNGIKEAILSSQVSEWLSWATDWITWIVGLFI